jgi:hypothetical protein
MEGVKTRPLVEKEKALGAVVARLEEVKESMIANRTG